MVLTGRIKNGRIAPGSPGSASRSCRRTGGRSRWSPTGPTRPKSDVVLQFYDLATEEADASRTSRRTPPLGHQDPAWRPDGKLLLYVRTAATGRAARRSIYRWNVANEDATPLTGPGYLEPSFSPDGRYIAATQTSTLRQRRRDPRRARTAAKLLRVTDDGRSWAPVWSPAGDAIAFLHIDGLIVDLKMAASTGTAPDWTVGDTLDLTEVSGLDGGSRPDWYVPPDELPAPTPRPSAAGAPPGPSGSTGPVTRDGYLERLAARSAAVGHGPVPGPRPGPGRAAARASRRTSRHRGFAALLSRPPRRSPRRSSRTSPSSRRSARAGIAALERIRAPIPADLPVIADAKRGDIGSTAARQAVALFDRLGADAVTVNPYLGREAHRAAPRTHRPVRLRPVPDVEPGRRRAPGPRRRGRPGDGAPAEPLYLRVARLAATWGPGGTVGLVVGATAPDELRRDPGRGARAWRSSCRASGAQGGDVEPVLARWPGDAPAPAGPRRRARPARQRLPGHRRGRAGAPATGAPGDLGAASRGGRPRLGRTPPCATLAARKGHASRRPGGSHGLASRRSTHRPCLPPDPSSWSSSW